MARTVKEWIGKNDNHMPPASVRQRILDRENGACHVCQGKIDKPGWHADHVKPLKDGGENRETNLKPAHPVCHKKRTADQAMERAPIERKKLKHTGAARPAGTIKSAPFSRSEKAAAREARAITKLPLPARRGMFAPGDLWPAGTCREE